MVARECLVVLHLDEVGMCGVEIKLPFFTTLLPQTGCVSLDKILTLSVLSCLSGHLPHKSVVRFM